MLTTQEIRELALASLGAETTYFNPGAGSEPYILLFKNNITPAESLTFANLVEADFDGYAAIKLGAGAQLVSLNPVDLTAVMDLRIPAGGFRWVTTGVTNLPQTVYGYALVNHAKTILLASANLDAPITLDVAGLRIDLGAPTLNLAANAID